MTADINGTVLEIFSGVKTMIWVGRKTGAFRHAAAYRGLLVGRRWIGTAIDSVSSVPGTGFHARSGGPDPSNTRDIAVRVTDRW
jgi:hypothetical protein